MNIEEIYPDIPSIKFEKVIEDLHDVLLITININKASMLDKTIDGRIKLYYDHQDGDMFFILWFELIDYNQKFHLPIELMDETKHWMGYIDQSMIRGIKIGYQDEIKKVHQYGQLKLL